jgi:uncharacterized cupredoxin-like copper-binding protein
MPGLALALVYLFGIGVIAVTAVAMKGDAKPAAAVTTVEVKLTEFKIAGNLTAPAGHVKLAVTNAGTVDHNVTVEGSDTATKLLAAGASQTLDLGVLPPGDVTIFCSVPGHKEAGMSATLKVTEAAGGAGGTEMAGHDMAGMDMSSSSATPDYAKMDADMLASFKRFPEKTKGVGNQVLQPTAILPDGTKKFELTAEVADWEVEAGRTVKAWTFNGIVPAPMFKLDVGDHVQVVVHNKLPVNTDVHWHGLVMPFAMDGVAPITQEPVKPGGDFTYDFTVDRPYMGMYHPHLHGVTAVRNGMFGVIQVGPTPIARGITVDGLSVPADVKPAVDMPMVLNDAGVIGFSLNGKSFPATAPIVVNQGDWIAVTYYNEGLQSHPMHLHEFPQLVTAKDGFPLPNPYWVDTLLVAPGERYTVMMHADQKGTWVYHCHILNHVERDTGMFGMVTAIVVK